MGSITVDVSTTLLCINARAFWMLAYFDAQYDGRGVHRQFRALFLLIATLWKHLGDENHLGAPSHIQVARLSATTFHKHGIHLLCKCNLVIYKKLSLGQVHWWTHGCEKIRQAICNSYREYCTADTRSAQAGSGWYRRASIAISKVYSDK